MITIIQSGRKQNGSSPNVLIDDKYDNIRKWRKKGGIGLQFQAGKDSLTTLLKRINEVIT